MFRNTLITLVAVLCLVLCDGCKKSKSTSASYNLKGSINGVAFNGTSAVALAGADSILNIFGGLFTGTAITPPYIFMNLCPYRGVGTYRIFMPPTGFTTVNYAAVNSTSYYAPATVSLYGSITITAASPAITGSFSFTALDLSLIHI